MKKKQKKEIRIFCCQVQSSDQSSTYHGDKNLKESKVIFSNCFNAMPQRIRASLFIEMLKEFKSLPFIRSNSNVCIVDLRARMNIIQMQILCLLIMKSWHVKKLQHDFVEYFCSDVYETITQIYRQDNTYHTYCNIVNILHM